jgi:hypothetical protein
MPPVPTKIAENVPLAGAANPVEIAPKDDGDAPDSSDVPQLAAGPATSDPAQALAFPKGELTVRAQGGISWAGFGDLMAWVSDSVEKIGAESTRTATEIYARAGYLDIGLQGIIFQLISQNPDQGTDREAATSDVVNALKGLNAVLVRASASGERPAQIEEIALG